MAIKPNSLVLVRDVLPLTREWIEICAECKDFPLPGGSPSYEGVD